MLTRIKQIARDAFNANAPHGRKVRFRFDARPTRVDGDANANEASARRREDVYVVRMTRRGKTHVSKESTLKSENECESESAGARAICAWSREDAPSSSVATLVARDGETTTKGVARECAHFGVGFEAKEYVVKLQRVVVDARDGRRTYVTEAKGVADIASFASIDGPMETRKIDLEVKSGASASFSGAKRVVLTIEARVVWLKHVAASDVDALTELSMVSGMESNWSASVKTDATPPGETDEQDLSGFANHSLHTLLSPVAESVSPVVVRQFARRESIAREALDDERRRVAELEVSLEEKREESNRNIRLLNEEKQVLSAQLKRTLIELEAAKAQAIEEKEAKELAITRVIEDMNAIENEKKGLEKAKNAQELELENLERLLREKDLDIERLKIAAAAQGAKSTTAFDFSLERERDEHAKEVERYRNQLDAADTQLAKLTLDYKQTSKKFEGELQLQAKARSAAEQVLEEELEDKSKECEELRQHLQSVIAETTMLTTSLKRAASDAIEAKLNVALAEASTARCDLAAVTEELADVRHVLDQHVIELVTSKVALAESQGMLLEVRRELLRTKQKLVQMSARATKLEVAFAMRFAESEESRHIAN